MISTVMAVYLFGSLCDYLCLRFQLVELAEGNEVLTRERLCCGLVLFEQVGVLPFTTIAIIAVLLFVHPVNQLIPA